MPASRTKVQYRDLHRLTHSLDAPVIASINSHVFTSWITIVWSMVAAACLSLAGLHLLVWSRHRKALGNLLFSISMITTAGMAAGELWMMQAATPAEFS